MSYLELYMHRLALVMVVFCLHIPQIYGIPKHTSFIFLGGTGDLARKYLWQALFNAYIKYENTEHQEHIFTITTGGLSNVSKGTVKLKEIFDNHIVCTAAHDSYSVCTSKKEEFFSKTTYFQLANTDDYKELCEFLQKSFTQQSVVMDKELILYLAVPPNVYLPALRNFKTSCSFTGLNVTMKVVLEKPQGHNKKSAEKLSEELLEMFEENQLYRTDHYLAKSLVISILPFRAANPQLERLLTREHVDRVEIFIKETVGIEERYSFYNEMGVIRDVFQNHLTQLLTLVTLDLPANFTAASDMTEDAKVHILQQIPHITQQAAVFGQYASYVLDSAREIPFSNFTALVPTFAAAVVKIQSPRWRDVPFILTSGKKLDEKSSYIRIVLKNNAVCVSHCNEEYLYNYTHKDLKQNDHHWYQHLSHLGHLSRQIIFQISHGTIKLPLISVSKSLGEPYWPESLEEMYDSDLFPPKRTYHGDAPESFFHATPLEKSDAYSILIEDILHGHREKFITTSQLLLAWHVWEDVLDLNPSKHPRTYDAGDPARVLNFVIKGSSLDFAQEDISQHDVPIHHLHNVQTPASFLGRRLVSGTAETIAVQLAQEIEQAAKADIESKGTFHLAFSGGTTPILLWQTLAQSFSGEYWAHVHIWQVDERCVRAAADGRSNLFHMDRQFLRFVGVPWAHVHTVPVELAGRLCDPELQGDRLYADSIRHHVPNLQLDFVVLGLGEDGHTASLFPRSPALGADSQTLVLLTDQGPRETKHRITMTLPLLNRAKRIHVLVTGKAKHDILEKLEETGNEVGSVDRYPILGVNPENGTLSWFIDYDAFWGDDFEGGFKI